jgi:hypothetical protein
MLFTSMKAKEITSIDTLACKVLVLTSVCSCLQLLKGQLMFHAPSMPNGHFFHATRHRNLGGFLDNLVRGGSLE